MRAMPHIWTSAAEDNETAAAYLQQAARIDPGYARANALLAWVFAQRLNLGWGGFDETRETASPLPGMQLPRIAPMLGPISRSDLFT